MAKRKPLSKLSKGTLLKRLREARAETWTWKTIAARRYGFVEKHDYLVRTLRRAEVNGTPWAQDIDVNRVLSYFKTQSTEGEKTP